MEPCMGTAEQALRNRILASYRSVRAFAGDCGLACSTVDNVLRRGVASVNLSTAAIICGRLGLDLYAFVQGEIVERIQAEEAQQRSLWESGLVDCCRRLDAHGRELVQLVAEKEAQRCTVASNGVAFPSTSAEREGWRQYLGAPIACRGGGVIQATEADARQMEKIYNRLLADRPGKKGGHDR